MNYTMLTGECKTIKYGFRNKYLIYENIHPCLSAVHTKLSSDGLILREEEMYLLGSGYALNLMGETIETFNSTFVNDLSACLGIYLEEYHFTDRDIFYGEIKRNSSINIAPPMVHFRFDQGTFLAIILSVNSNRTYTIINPLTKDIDTVPEACVDYSKAWYMMNSPRFLKPVFRSKKEMFELGIYKLLQRNVQFHLLSGKGYLICGREQLILKMYEERSRVEEAALRDLFERSIEYLEEQLAADFKDLRALIHKTKLLWNKLKGNMIEEEAISLITEIIDSETIIIKQLTDRLMTDLNLREVIA